MTRVVITDHAFGTLEQEEAMAHAEGAEFGAFQCVTEEETIEAVRGADAVIVNFAPITDAVLASLADGATVVRYGIGYDNVDLAAAARRGVQVANVPDYGTDVVADHAAAMALMLMRRIPEYNARIRADGWCRPATVGQIPSVGAATLGLVGLGRIAQAVATRFAAFGTRVVAYDPMVQAEVAASAGVALVDLDQLVAAADVVSLHAPVTDDTRHMINAALLAAFKPNAVLVNTSRGALIDEAALAAALKAEQLAWAGLDVFETEPLPQASPLWECDNVVFTPHAAYYSQQSQLALQRLASEEAARALRGEPLRCPIA